MRNAAVGLVTLLLFVSCSGSVTTTSTQVQSQFEVIETDGDADAPEAPAVSFDEPADEAPAVEQEAPVEQEAAVEQEEPADTGDGLFPTVVGASASTSDGSSWRVDVTLSSEYDSPERYADAWRVLDADDNELGIRVLGHDHANEQPFTRSHSVDIPSELTTVFIEGRDQVNGWSGERYELTLTP